MCFLRFFLCVGVLVISSATAWADLPFTVEDLLTDKNKLRLDLSIAYANADRRSISTGESVIIQTGPTSFVTLPTLIGENIGNSDIVAATLGLRYGLTANAELYARMSGLWSEQRNNRINSFSTNSSSHFTDAWTGINYKFKEDDRGPAIFGFTEIALCEKHRISSSSFKSILLGLTTYKAIDPIVFSLTAAYRLNKNRQDGHQQYKPGNLLLLNPSVAFAVNDRVTLTSGLQWTHRQSDQLDDQHQDINRTATDLLLGVGYGFSRGNTLNATLKINASRHSGSELRVDWLYTF